MTDCPLPWYKSFSGQCALAGGGAGGIIAMILSGGFTWAAAGAFGPGVLLGTLIAYCACRMSAGRLPKISPTDTSFPGIVDSISRSLPLFPFGDGDFLFNLVCIPTQAVTPNNNGAQGCIREQGDGTPFLHCEITSNVTLYGCAGAIAGLAATIPIAVGTGAAAGAAAAAACLALGIFAPLCILAAIIVALIVSSAIAGAGGLAGGAIGSAAGAAADEIENQVGDAGADSLAEGDVVVFTGDHVTDADHGWNEIHDIKGVDMIGRELDCDRALKRTGAVAMGLMARAG